MCRQFARLIYGTTKNVKNGQAVQNQRNKKEGNGAKSIPFYTICCGIKFELSTVNAHIPLLNKFQSFVRSTDRSTDCMRDFGITHTVHTAFQS